MLLMVLQFFGNPEIPTQNYRVNKKSNEKILKNLTNHYLKTHICYKMKCLKVARTIKTN